MGLKVLHTGDWHIGNFPGPEQNGENARYLDVCKCLDALVAGAKEQQPEQNADCHAEVGGRNQEESLGETNNLGTKYVPHCRQLVEKWRTAPVFSK